MGAICIRRTVNLHMMMMMMMMMMIIYTLCKQLLHLLVKIGQRDNVFGSLSLFLICNLKRVFYFYFYEILVDSPDSTLATRRIGEQN